MNLADNLLKNIFQGNQTGGLTIFIKNNSDIERSITHLNKQEYIIEGSMNLDDLNDQLELEFSSEDYDSLGGFIIEHLDRLPEVNDEIMTADGIRLVVEKLDKNRVEKVHLYLPEDYYEKNKQQKVKGQPQIN